MPAAVCADDATAVVVGFARTLRAAGVSASPGRVDAFVSALEALTPTRRRDVYWAGRLTLCAGVDDLARYDRAFAAYFDPDQPRPTRPRGQPRPRLQLVADVATVDAATETDQSDETGAAPAAALASATEVLRHRDIADVAASDRAALRRMLQAFALPGALRRTRRRAPSRRGEVDRGRTLRVMLRRGGESADLRRRAPRRRPRRVVLLVDVSGSMSAYADALLRFAHAASRHSATRTEVFTIGTQLTRVSRELAHRDPDLAMRAVAGAVPDWAGGTRLGELLRAFLDRWGQRGMARGAVVVVLSDGWERGDPALLGGQMARLARLAHRVVWANPRKARPGYAPYAAGMAAALPHVDAFVEGHSVAALEHLAAVVGGSAQVRDSRRGAR